MTIFQGTFVGAGAGRLSSAWSTDLRQLHYRFRTDAGAADASPTWGAVEDQSYYPGSSNFRLRMQLLNAGAVVAQPWELYVSKNGGAYAPVTTVLANGVQSVDAGASADDTQVLVPRLYPFESTADWTLSGASVDLDFAGNRIYPWSAAFADFLSISRASTGYAKDSKGSLISFGTDTLRITDLGLLIEDARTNIVLYSAITTLPVNWSDLGADKGAATTAPDGTNTAQIDSRNTAATNHGMYQTYTTTAAAWTSSIYLKANGYNYGSLVVRGSVKSQTIVADLTTGVITSTNSQGSPTNVSTGTEVLANGWVRLWITMDLAAESTLIGAFMSDAAVPSGGYSNAIPVFTSPATDGVGFIVWGFQMEAGSFVSSYIPTTAISATRAADSITLGGLLQTTIAAATGTIVSQIGNSEGSNFAANIVDSNGTNIVGFDATNHGLASLIATLATGNTANRSTIDDKLGLAWSAAGRSLVLNNGTIVTDASAQTPSSTQKLGSASGTSNFIYAYVKRISAWNSKLADATLQGFTAP